MANKVNVIYHRYLACTDAAGTGLVFYGDDDAGAPDATQPIVAAALYLFNSGATDVWIKIYSLITMTPAPVASNANGRTLIKALTGLSLDDIEAVGIKAICAAAGTTDLQIIITQRPGSNSGGF